ncbi:MAG: hypothetical protein ACFFD4_23575 [Candidatus Odinarchaeota archaeon]
MKESESVTLYMNLRSVKIAFFIPAKEEALAEIISFSKGTWNGIHHLIIPVKSGNIHPMFISMVEEMVPDVYAFYDEKTYSELDEESVKKLEKLHSSDFHFYKEFDTFIDSYGSLGFELHFYSSVPSGMPYQTLFPLLISNIARTVGFEYPDKIKLLWNDELLRNVKLLTSDYDTTANFFTAFLIVITDNFEVEDLCLFWNLRAFFYYEKLIPTVLLIPKFILESKNKKENFHKVLSREYIASGERLVPQITLTSLSLSEECIDNLFNQSGSKLFVKTRRNSVEEDQSEYADSDETIELEYTFVNRLLGKGQDSLYFFLKSTEVGVNILHFTDNKAKLHYRVPRKYRDTTNVILEITGHQMFNLPIYPRFGELFCDVPALERSYEIIPENVQLKQDGLCFKYSILPSDIVINLRIPSSTEIFQKYFAHHGYSFEKTSRTDPINQIVNFLDNHDTRIQDGFLSADVKNLFLAMTHPSRRKIEPVFLEILEESEDYNLKEDIRSFLDNISFYPRKRYKKLSEIKGVLKGKEELIEILVRNRIFLRGFLVTCRVCGYESWYPLGSIGEEYTCSGCLSNNHTPVTTKYGELSVHYMLNHLQQKVMDQDFFPEIASIIELKREYQHTYSFYYPSCEIKARSKNLEVEKAELDGMFLLDNMIILIEAKMAGKVSEKEIADKIKLTKIFKPSKVIFYSYEGWKSTFTEKFAGEQNIEFRDINTD